MNRELIFIGGSKGVGKTSLAKAISNLLDFEYINTGERFRKYRPEFDKKFIQELIDVKGRFIIDTHYAASSSKTPYDFHIGIDKEYQMHLRFNSEYFGKIVLVEASPELVLQRRREDGEERRCLELDQIVKENNFNSEYSIIYSSYLKLPYYSFINENLSMDEAIIKLKNIIKNE